MSIQTRSNLAVLGFLLLISTPDAGLAQQQSIEGAYRGSIVCEHLAGTAGILRAPLDIDVSGTTVVAARPIFNRDGTRVVGSEIATGTVNADGTLRLTSSWAAAGGSFKGTYNGTLNATGGTVTGTEAWTRSPGNGGNVSRGCYGAYVRGPTPGGQSSE
jgi:hypothetical protein